MVRLRQFLDRTRHRLLFVPGAFVLAALVLSQTMLWIDRRLANDDLPQVLETTVDGGRAILSAIAGGLIASITLLLSLMLVAVQLAGSQFSPRTLRDWIGDRTQQLAIGVVLGTTVYCLLILRETRAITEGDALTPHLSILLAVVLGVSSLVAVVRSVDHLTNSLRIGAVAGRIMKQTMRIIGADTQPAPAENPAVAPVSQPARSELEMTLPVGALPVTAATHGWIQQIDEAAIIKAIPSGSTIYLTIAHGTFTMPDAPIAWLWPSVTEDHPCIKAISESIAIGDSRTLQQDIGFGILQMVDIALRALSPGVNDPNTANDMIVHLGVVMLVLWEQPLGPGERNEEGRTLVRFSPTHADYLHAGFDQIRLYGAGDPTVMGTIVRVLNALRRETQRRGLPGPLEPIEEVIAQVVEAVDATSLSEYDKSLVHTLIPADFPDSPGG